MLLDIVFYSFHHFEYVILDIIVPYHYTSINYNDYLALLTISAQVDINLQ